MSSTSRSYCFTLHDDYFDAATDGVARDLEIAEWFDKLYSGGGVNYLVGQLERGEETGRLHVQGYIELSMPRRIAWVKRAMGADSVHLERRHGTAEQGQ